MVEADIYSTVLGNGCKISVHDEATYTSFNVFVPRLLIMFDLILQVIPHYARISYQFH